MWDGWGDGGGKLVEEGVDVLGRNVQEKKKAQNVCVKTVVKSRRHSAARSSEVD